MSFSNPSTNWAQPSPTAPPATNTWNCQVFAAVAPAVVAPSYEYYTLVKPSETVDAWYQSTAGPVFPTMQYPAVSYHSGYYAPSNAFYSDDVYGRNLSMDASMYASYQYAVEAFGQSQATGLSWTRSAQFDADVFLQFSVKEVLEYSQDHLSSIHLQDFLKKGKDHVHITEIISRLVNHFVTLTFDPIGNYVAQALIEIADDANFQHLFQIIVNAGLLETATHCHGTRVIQKFLTEGLARGIVGNVVAALQPYGRQMATDSNGCYVLLKVLDEVPQAPAAWVYDIIFQHLPSICCQQWGVVTVKRCIDKVTAVDALEGSGAQSCLKQLISAFVAHFDTLSRDQYGNYGVQHLLQSDEIILTEQGGRCIAQMIEIVGPKLAELSKHKYSSNCMEHLIGRGGSHSVSMLMSALVPNVSGSSTTSLMVVRDLLMDKYGNYVLQKVLQVASENQRQTILAHVHPCIHELIKPHSNSGFSGAGDDKTLRLVKKIIQKYPQLGDRKSLRAAHAPQAVAPLEEPFMMINNGTTKIQFRRDSITTSSDVSENIDHRRNSTNIIRPAPLCEVKDTYTYDEENAYAGNLSPLKPITISAQKPARALLSSAAPYYPQQSMWQPPAQYYYSEGDSVGRHPSFHHSYEQAHAEYARRQSVDCWAVPQ